MSQAIFPVLPGLTWPQTKSPQFNNAVKRTPSLREYRAAYAQYPLWTFTLSYDFLRDSATFPELQALIGFFLARQGSFDNFLYDDSSDDVVVDQVFGTGDGVNTVFPLIRTYGAGGFTAVDVVQNVNAIINIKDNGTAILQGSGAGKYTVDSLGNITFGTIPIAGHTLTWTGAYYYRCRFLTDTQTFSKFMNNVLGGGLWDLNSQGGSQNYIQFIGSTQNKV